MYGGGSTSGVQGQSHSSFKSLEVSINILISSMHPAGIKWRPRLWFWRKFTAGVGMGDDMPLPVAVTVQQGCLLLVQPGRGESTAITCRPYQFSVILQPFSHTHSLSVTLSLTSSFPPKISPDLRQSHEWSWSEQGGSGSLDSPATPLP